MSKNKTERKSPKEIKGMVNCTAERIFEAMAGKGSVVLMVEGLTDDGSPFISCAHRGRLTSVVGLIDVGSDMMRESVSSDITEDHATVNGELYYDEDDDDEEDPEENPTDD